MIKHDNYDQNEEIQLSRLDKDLYRLFYESENYELVATKEEVLEELGEHMELKKYRKPDDATTDDGVYVVLFRSWGFEESTDGEVLGVVKTKAKALEILNDFSMTDDDGKDAPFIDELTRAWGDDERGESLNARRYHLK